MAESNPVVSNLPYISYVLNIILIALFLFKSALNNILKKWWDDRSEKKKESVKRYHELRCNINELHNLSLLVFFALGIKKNRPELGTEGKNASRYDDYLTQWGNIQKDITNNSVYYSSDIESLIKKYLVQMRKFNDQILRGNINDPQQLIPKNDEVRSTLKSILELVDSKIK